MTAVDALSRSAVAVLQLNGRFVALLNELARNSGLSAAQWQVLDAVGDGPRTVSDIARLLGTTRQSVQRLADLLVDQGLAAYRDNPAHRRARLLTATGPGRAALRDVGPGHAELAEQLCEKLGGEAELRRTVESLNGLSRALCTVAPRVPS
ncbi:MarR family transcriptional regulator [Streptomyces sp. 15-116A]|uniref:MarR family winged helix-turn-helix transcriptional regulator n=1 Tax=Streptomyces sp. 15-116A TaxID=2259035 RepID=UPI0021B3461F|nr:MarR family transcriptional regulator [Streptomyces sp. 15-116A]MCT7354136.1 MarR family transcriptional regulator [Streptomyces sp. 15-116A]